MMNILSVTFSDLLTPLKLEILRNHQILTSLDFVQTNNEKIAHMIGSSVGDIIKIKEKILSSNNSRAVRGDKYYDFALKTTVLIGSGIESVDRFFGGGFQTGTVTEICGNSCSGKTQFALHLTAHAALNQLQSVAYLSTGDLNPKSVFEYMQSMKKGTEVEIKEALERISFGHISDVYELLEALWEPRMVDFKVVIIDSLATLFLPLLGDSFNDAISLLNKVASDLKRLSVENRCLVLVINHASNWSGTETHFLGRYWMHVPNLRLHSRRLNDSRNDFEWTVVRNVYCPAVQEKCCFQLPSSNK